MALFDILQYLPIIEDSYLYSGLASNFPDLEQIQIFEMALEDLVYAQQDSSNAGIAIEPLLSPDNSRPSLLQDIESSYKVPLDPQFVQDVAVWDGDMLNNAGGHSAIFPHSSLFDDRSHAIMPASSTTIDRNLSSDRGWKEVEDVGSQSSEFPSQDPYSNSLLFDSSSPDSLSWAVSDSTPRSIPPTPESPQSAPSSRACGANLLPLPRAPRPRCSQCFQTFSDQRRLKRHLGTHQTFKCDLDSCTRSFKDKRPLERHKQTGDAHQRSREYRCTCGSEFSRKDRLLRHARKCRNGPQRIETPRNRGKSDEVTLPIEMEA
ncbi:hypothetical protein BU16DRAFT_541212 [Lophium mytilinum]|uniref:C2H2 type master regulator of conidiophore development brlA n=1 Tax=Lophium mytilinum TaxID=390894 RepID=A0A6A6QN28_9PEZI|nr:hypothetical protein BU16DRAFT_541212 [Lophium mytilinum]